MADRRLTWRGAAAMAAASGLLGLAIVIVSPRPPGPGSTAPPPAEAPPVVVRFDYALKGCTTSSREPLLLECGDSYEGALVDFRQRPPTVLRWRVETTAPLPRATPSSLLRRTP